MLLVDDDQSQPRQRGKHRQPRTQHQVGLAPVRQQPVAQALCRRQRAVQRHQPPSGKALGKARLQLRREVDLRHQHQHLPPLLQRPCGAAQVDLGLAAAGDALQQGRPGVSLRQRGQLLERSGLLLGQLRQPRRLRHRFLGQAPEALEPARHLRVVELAQLGRQHRQRHLADAALVIAGAELDQLHPRRAQRRQAGHGGLHRAQLRHFGALAQPAVPDHAGHAAPAQRHLHQAARRQRRFAQIVQRGVQPGVLRRVHDHRHKPRLAHRADRGSCARKLGFI